MIKPNFYHYQVIFKGDFFRKNLLLHSDVVFDFESNNINFSSLALSGGEKKIFTIFFTKF